MSEPKPLSYHDVVVYVNEKPYRITDNYAYELTCTRVGGWKLWHTWNGKSTPIGGEFDGTAFRIEVAGIAMCHAKPSAADDHGEPS